MRRLRAPLKRPAERESTIPLINVVFLLLVFFIVAGTLSAPRARTVDFATARAFDPAALLATIESERITVSQLERRSCFPRRVEAVNAIELDRASGETQLVEHAASTHGLELMVVADENESPVVPVGETDESGKRRGPDHPCLINEHGCAGR